MTRRSIALAASCAALTVAAGLATISPSTAATPPSLTATATFGKASYVSGQTESVRLSVHNSGTTSAVGITASSQYGATDLVVDQRGFGKLGTGLTIGAGKTARVTVTGHLGSSTATTVTFEGSVYDRSGDDVADFAASAPVSVRSGKVTGVVFADANSNGKPDAQEGLKGAKINLSYSYGGGSYSVTTGRGGRFVVVVPAGSYYVSGSSRPWVVIPRVVNVNAAGGSLSLRAVRPLGKVLKATLKFTKHTYKPGNTAHITLTLTNTGSKLLRGIGPECDRAGEPGDLANTGKAWGSLTVDGPGVILRAHQTRTFHVSAKVPAEAQRAGELVIACDFGYAEVERGYRPQAIDTAKVPGQTGAIDGVVYIDPDTSRGLKNVRVELVDPTTCPVYSRTAKTDSKGRFHFSKAPAGSSYQLYFFPPKGWKIDGDNPTPALVFGKDTVNFFVAAKRGSAHVAAPPTKCSTG